MSTGCAVCGAPVAADDWLCVTCRGTATDRYLSVATASEADRSYASGIFSELATLEEHSFWFRSRNALLTSLLRRHFPDARRVFEIGCGTGYVLAALQDAAPSAEVVGAELYRQGLDVARERLPGVALFQADARALAFTAAFDVVAAFDVLEHIDDDVRALESLRRAVTPAGGLMITVPQHPWLWSAADDFGEHKRRYTRRELLAKVEGAGFEPVQVTSFVSSLLPLMALDRLRPRRAGDYDYRREFRRSRAVDRALESVLGVERRMIAAGVSLPFGGSLVVVARAVSPV